MFNLSKILMSFFRLGFVRHLLAEGSQRNISQGGQPSVIFIWKSYWQSVSIIMLSAFFLFAGSGIVHSKPIPKNGVLREYHANGQMRLETRYKKGLLVRKRTFYKNGKSFVDHRFKQGALVDARTYYDNGRLKSIWTEKSGVTKYYYKTGKLKAVIDLDNKNLNKNLKSSYIFSGP